MTIRILPDSLINKIAAGEVVERPASVVKELIENSIDAAATEIFIDIERAGKRLIRVSDNGSGMPREDALLCFERHATSKIEDEEDLSEIRTMGFRGEALSSIAAVSRVRMITAAEGRMSGTLVEIEGGKVRSVSDAARPAGTTIEVSHLFFNTPARLKFLKSPSTEFSHILAAVSRQAMACPHIRFRLTHNSRPIFDVLPSATLKERAYHLYGAEIADNLLEFDEAQDGIGIHGLISPPGFTRSDRLYQEFYINRRYIKNPTLTHALYAAYSNALMKDRHPAAIVFIDMDPALVDVNVHPAKAEVRFKNQSQIHDIVMHAIQRGLGAKAASTAIFRAERVMEAVSDYLSKPAEGTSFTHAVADERFFTPKTHDARPHASSQVSSTEQFGLYAGDHETLQPLAQIHGSFIIAQSSEGMAIIDQHAAHERVLFEALKEQYGYGDIHVQNLLIPEQVELGHADGELLSGRLDDLRRLGLVVEDFGRGAFVIKAVPALLSGSDYRLMLLDILDELRLHDKSRRIEALTDAILSVMACRPAVKVNRALGIKEMQTLIHDLFSCRMPYTCPHGRPTIVRFSIEDIKKMFKRT